MELMMQEAKGYSHSRELELEEEEEEEEELAAAATAEDESRLHHNHHQDAASTRHHHRHQQLDFMDLSLGTNNKHIEANNFQPYSSLPLGQYATTSSTNTNNNNQQQEQQQQQEEPQPCEKEHMFDKVVTPSDVGKLNRLVIPKQHAEKYFPLDSTTNEKGLLLNFEDRNGKLWRFRYSYWNSSQSYVMTKGWSRFVKEKKLDAGDIVSFQRGVGELYRHRLYIDWRRRSNHHHHGHHGYHGYGYGPADPSSSPNTLITPFFLPNNQQQHLMSQYSIRFGGRFYSLPNSIPQTPSRHHQLHHDQQQFQPLNYSNMHPFHQQQHHQHQHGGGSFNSSGSESFYYLRPSMSMTHHDQGLTRQQQQQHDGGNNIVAPMIIDSVPVSHHNHHNHHGGSGSGNTSNSGAGKMLRLFGVNMECASSPTPEDPKIMANNSSVASSSSSSFSSFQPLQLLRVPHHEELPLLSSSSTTSSSAMVFDLDPSLQYRH